MQIPSDIKYIRKVSSRIEDLLRYNNVEESQIFDIRLCVEEAVKNAIIHGNKKDRKRPVFITYSLEDDRVVIEIEDQGEGFDPKKVPDPTQDENIFTAGGRGVFIIHKLMDEVKYNSRGNKLFMVKFLKRDKEALNAD